MAKLSSPKDDIRTERNEFWEWLFAKRSPPYLISGKYLFFSPDRQILLSLARFEIAQGGFHRAKVNVPAARIGSENVLCLYYRDDSRSIELARRYRGKPRVRYRGWKSDEATERGEYSDKHMAALLRHPTRRGERSLVQPKRLELGIELVPGSLWNRTLAQLSSRGRDRGIWNRVREVELKRAGGACEVCGQPARHVHERWDYDDEYLVQSLNGFEVLCQECHLVHHPGFAAVHGLEDLALKRFMRVNSLTRATASQLVREAFDQWAARTARKPWTQDFTWLSSHAASYGLDARQIERAVEQLDEPEDSYPHSELWGVPSIGGVRAGILEGLGITTIERLAAVDAADLLARSPTALVRDVSFPSQLPIAVNFARAISNRQPIAVSHSPILSGIEESRILFVDLEYDPQTAFIFLMGSMSMDGRVKQHFVETATDLRRCLQSFLGDIRKGDHQCVSYGSTSADVPMLRRALANAGMESALVDNIPFLDLFRDVIFTQNAQKQWLYLPLKPMDAKSVASYFGYTPPRNLAIRDGFEALIRYKEYLRTRNPKIAKQLVRYNASDLKLTRRIFEEIRNLETVVRSSGSAEPRSIPHSDLDSEISSIGFGWRARE